VYDSQNSSDEILLVKKTMKQDKEEHFNFFFFALNSRVPGENMNKSREMVERIEENIVGRES